MSCARTANQKALGEMGPAQRTCLISFKFWGIDALAQLLGSGLIGFFSGKNHRLDTELWQQLHELVDPAPPGGWKSIDDYQYFFMLKRALVRDKDGVNLTHSCGAIFPLR